MVLSKKWPGASAEGTAERAPWEQMPGESSRWYGRFQIYLGLGPTRTLRQAQCSLPLREDGTRPIWTGKWSWIAAAWQWRERAQAWDEHQRNLLALSERNVRRGLHHRRVSMIEETLETIRDLFGAANLQEVDQETARAWLPQLRVFLHDMLAAERQEFEHDYTGDDHAAAAPITADDLRAAQRALAQGAQQVAPPKSATRQGDGQGDGHMDEATGRRRLKQQWRANCCPLLVCTGPEPELRADLAALRAVRAATGLTFTRVLNATQRKLDGTLRRQRGMGYPVEYIHMAAPVTAAGVELADGAVDGDWLSARLAGVRVLLLANCETHRIGEWRGVVPYVITLQEDIPHQDVAVLVRHFWQGIGNGQEPGAALDGALAQCPPAVGAHVVRHW